MDKKALLMGSLLGLMAVMIGAFGAHGLKELLEINDRLAVFETAVKYQFYHAFALLMVGVIAEKIKGSWVKRAVYSFVSGTVIFSGSLYILSMTNIGIFGAITPVGGVLLIAGWIFMIFGILKQK